MATSEDAQAFPGLQELRLYRELDRRRNHTIRALASNGVSLGRIAGAAGISVTQVRRIVRTKG